MDPTQLQIPQREAGEPAASPEQLQLIRQLVDGLSLHGYRFDYIKLGEDQASAVIEQLMQLQGTSKNAAGSQAKSNRSAGPGCVASLVRGVTQLIVVLAFFGMIGGTAYYYFFFYKPSQSTHGTGPAAQSNGGEEPDDSASAAGTRESSIFSGLSVREDQPQPADNTDNSSPNDQKTITPPSITPPSAPQPDPTLTLDQDTIVQIKKLEELLVSLSQYTRSSFEPGLRAQSLSGMQTRLVNLDKALAYLDHQQPGLTDRVRKVILQYGEPTIDGVAIRAEIKAIREAIKTAGL